MQFSRGFRQQTLAWSLACLCLGQEALSAHSSLRAHRVQNHNHDLYHDDADHQSHIAHQLAQDHERHLQNDERNEVERILNGKPIRHLKKKLMQRIQNQRVEDIVDRLGDKIPASVASLVKKTSMNEGSSGEFSEESLAKARRILNGMIEDAQERLDLKTIDCHNFRDRNRGNLEQVVADQSRLGAQLADLARLIADANDGLKEIADKTEQVEEEMAAAKKAYDDTHDADAAEMVKRKDDLAVAEFILRFTICKDKQWPKKMFFQQAEDAQNLPEQTHIGVLKCEGQEGNVEFRFEDPKLEAQAEKYLTPGARMKLRKWLAGAHSMPSLVQTPASETEDDSDDDDDLDDHLPAVQDGMRQANEKEEDSDDDDDLDDQTPAVQHQMQQADEKEEDNDDDDDLDDHAPAVQHATSSVGFGVSNNGILSRASAEDKEEDSDDDDLEPPKAHDISLVGSGTTTVTTTTVTIPTTTKTAATTSMSPTVAVSSSSTPVASLIRKSSADPSMLPAKCTLGKPNCGLLHDNMSIMWGKFKDQVDELQDKMDEDDKNWEQLKADYNGQLETFTAQSGQLDAQLGEATANQNADREESNKKDEEERMLEAEYKEVWGECAATMYEILYTDICGVLTVRGEVSKYSKKVPPEAITDCEVTEFIEGECMRKGQSLTCDNQCDPHGGTPNCGGIKILTREVVQQKNKFGMKCPKLTYDRKCSQFKCPVDCMMTEWTGWTKCTKDCEGGTMMRTRNLHTKPKNGGAPCDAPQESRSCNTGSCDRDCRLRKWSKWAPCTAACGGGRRKRFRSIKIPTRGGGKCYKHDSRHRLQWEKCNTEACVGDEQCVAHMDIIVAIDASGSMRESGFKILRSFAAKLVKRFDGEFAGNEAVKVGAILFGNGMLLPSGIVSPAEAITPLLDFDAKKVSEEIEKTAWQKGFTNLAQVFTKADEMSLVSGRKKAHSQIIVVTDGKPSFEFNLRQEVEKIKAKGVNIVMVETNKNLGKLEDSLVRSLASQPPQANYVHIPGVKALKKDMESWVQRVLVQSCPRAISFSKMDSDAEVLGYKLIREKFWCGEVKEKDVTPHKYLGTVSSPGECMQKVVEQEKSSDFFAYGTEANFNEGHCYMEETKDVKCPEGFESYATNFYKILSTASNPFGDDDA